MKCWWHLRPDNLKHHLSVQQTSQDKQNHIAVRSFSKDHFFLQACCLLKTATCPKTFYVVVYPGGIKLHIFCNTQWIPTPDYT